MNLKHAEQELLRLADTWARHRPECCGTNWPAHPGVLVDCARTSRTAGARPGGWLGRGPA